MKIDEWYEKQFREISRLLQKEKGISYLNFLRIRNFKIQNKSKMNAEDINSICKSVFNDIIKKGKDYLNIPFILEQINNLNEMDGVRLPVASAILAMKFPNDFAIIDKNALEGVNEDPISRGNFKGKILSNKKKITQEDAELYVNYIKFLKNQIGEHGKDLREVEFDYFKKGREILKNEHKKRKKKDMEEE